MVTSTLFSTLLVVCLLSIPASLALIVAAHYLCRDDRHGNQGDKIQHR